MAIYAVAPELREAFDLDPFYKKDVDAGGIPILASRSDAKSDANRPTALQSVTWAKLVTF